MAKYTTTVRAICENYTGKTAGIPFSDISAVITHAIPKIFTLDYEMFDEEYRVPLYKKILKHYYTREICEETVELWKLRLNTRLSEIMPYYNQLYKSALLEFDPLITTKLERTYTLGREGETVTEGEKITEKEITDNLSANGVIDKNVTDNTTVTDNGERHLTSNDNDNITGTSTDNMKRDEVTDGTSNTTQKTSEVKEQTENENENVDTTNVYEHDNTHYDLFSETPQGGLNGIESGEYLTTARKTTDKTTDERTINSEKDRTDKINLTDNTDFTGNLIDKKEFTADNVDSKNYNENVTKEKTADETNENTKTTTGKVQDKTTNNNTEERTINGNETEGINNRVGVKNTDEYIENLVGKTGGNSYASLILEFRKTLINVDKMIIEELEDLFFMLW